MLAGTAMQRFGDKLQDEQEVLTYLADILIDTYAAESALLRAQRVVGGRSLDGRSPGGCGSVYVHEAAGRIELAARSAWRRWPTATRCARSWRRCAGC